MTEKRFTLEEFGLNFIVNDNGRNLTAKQTVDRLNDLNDENEQLKSKNRGLQSELQIFKKDVEHSNLQMNKLADENEQLKSENQRLTDKLNKTALELVGECISQGKATEISEMSYREFLDYRAKNGKPMELQK